MTSWNKAWVKATVLSRHGNSAAALSPSLCRREFRSLTAGREMADEQAIRTVINQQFGVEVAYKEGELQRIDDRIQLAKMMLHRLRLGILAQQYGLSGFYLAEDYSKENIGVQVSWNSFESDFLDSQRQEQEVKERKKETGAADGQDMTTTNDAKQEESAANFWEGASSVGSSVQSSRVPSEAGDDEISTTSDPRSTPEVAGIRKVSSLLNDLRRYPPSNSSLGASVMSAGASTSSGPAGAGFTRSVRIEEPPPGPSPPTLPASLSRFTTKKRVIVGNTSQFLAPSARSTIDGSTHKWMVYVRGPDKEADITSFVKAVRFFLHPSYHPNDIIRIAKPPFHLTRYGWGEFPVRVQLEFTDKSNKHVDIIHNLVLDRTHTGHQTLGSETVVDLDLVTSECLATKAKSEPAESSVKNSSLHPFSPSLNRTRKRESSTKAEGDVSTAASGEISRHIYHVFLPAVSTLDQVLLDHNYSQIVVVSQRPKSSQQTPGDEAMDTYDLEGSGQANLDNEGSLLDEYLHSVVKTVPLCGPETNGFHLVCQSFNHFRRWNVGRRRASEWMRALAVKKLLQSLEPPVPTTASLTTRQVVEWCRKNGYTPLDPTPSSSRGFCKYCGFRLPSCWEESDRGGGNSHTRCLEMMAVQVAEEGRQEQEVCGDESGSSDSEPEQMEEGGEEEDRRTVGKSATAQIKHNFSTLSDPFHLFESLTVRAKQLKMLQEQQARDQVVDVLSLPSRRHQAAETIPRFRVPQTPELKWVQRTAAAIGICIYPAVIDHMYAHVVEHMIYMACTKFARMIMDRAVTESAQQLVEGVSNEERCIVPLHIYRAVESLECCDFLTNAYMGVPLPKTATEPPPTASDRDKTLREE